MQESIYVEDVIEDAVFHRNNAEYNKIKEMLSTIVHEWY